MGFQQYDLGHQQRGSAVEVTLSGNAANVQLLDSTNPNTTKPDILTIIRAVIIRVHPCA